MPVARRLLGATPCGSALAPRDCAEGSGQPLPLAATAYYRQVGRLSGEATRVGCIRADGADP